MTSPSHAPSSDQDVVDILTSDHREALLLVDDIKTATDPQARRDMADQLIAELVRHSVAEEMFVYPAMEEHLPNGKEAVEHDTKEHNQLEQKMKAMEDVDASDPRFLQLLSELEAILRDHVHDEEAEQFPQLRATLSPEDLRKMGQKVEMAKKAAPTRPHPDAPNNEYFHKLVGPGVGLVDRLRDRISGRSTG